MSAREHARRILGVMPSLVPGIHVLPTTKVVVDGRDKPGHDVERPSLSFVMPGLVPGIHLLLATKERRGWPGQAMTTLGASPATTNDAPPLYRHARLDAGHPRLCSLTRDKDVDGRDRGVRKHAVLWTAMPGHDSGKIVHSSESADPDSVHNRGTAAYGSRVSLALARDDSL